ncbi:uncharacterized protein LAESUDRAFT_732108 [Laetiporus sulphureus 93-53]|uniref:HTH La-type RNA-binding domain-containing protein n=1 Tax=Laetiporus sulphureus 93-53 TaxID=1314785 RepID=A0A165BAD1_9APHY|nr:uncharacterized protein LAESUDRAFT_732108 [Laetiporus sulphureus 93-53]KZT00612.1 hypothetical protein LAESUDRAFT_732108 [Laetiporus sulphureus 93-53]
MDVEEIQLQPFPRTEDAEVTVTAVDSAANGLRNIHIDEDDQNEQALNALRQVEFYFSDSNLPYDRFMWTLHTVNADRWVPIATIATFKRMREYQLLGSQWLMNILRQSYHLEVNDEGTHIRRRTEVKQNSDWDRSIYAKGFGADVDGLQRELERFFNRYGRTNAVRMRREQQTKAFKGSVFVEFTDSLSAERFLNADPKPSWNGQDLIIMTKEAYCSMKVQEKGLIGKAAIMRRNLVRDPTNKKGFNAFQTVKATDKEDATASKRQPYPPIRSQRVGVEQQGAIRKSKNQPQVRKTVNRGSRRLGRTIYAKGFGEEADGMQMALETFFNQFGKTIVVEMRRNRKTKKFKGSVFVEFTEHRFVQLFLHANPAPTWDNQPLLTMSKSAYIKMKIRERKEALRQQGVIVTCRDEATMETEETPAAQGIDNGDEAKMNVDVGAKTKRKNHHQRKGTRANLKETKLKEPPRSFLFLGQNVPIQFGENGVWVKEEEVPSLKGTSMMFEGSDEALNWSDVKIGKDPQLRLQLRRRLPPFVHYRREAGSGLVDFKLVLTEDDIAYIKKHVRTVNGKELSWKRLDEQSERQLQLARALANARGAMDFYHRKCEAAARLREQKGGVDAMQIDNVPPISAPVVPDIIPAASSKCGEKRKRMEEYDDIAGAVEPDYEVRIVRGVKRMKIQSK